MDAYDSSICRNLIHAILSTWLQEKNENKKKNTNMSKHSNIVHEYLALSGVRPLRQILRFKIRRADKLESFVIEKEIA